MDATAGYSHKDFYDRLETTKNVEPTHPRVASILSFYSFLFFYFPSPASMYYSSGIRFWYKVSLTSEIAKNRSSIVEIRKEINNIN